MLSIQQCLQCVFRTFTIKSNTNLKTKAIIKKYSLLDGTPPCSENSMQRQAFSLDEEATTTNEQNCYKDIKGDNIFVMPDIDEEVENDQRQIRNVSIQGCENGNFIIMKSIENAYIDACKQSFIFIGPCHSTVFIRNCKNIKIRSISQQLRIQNSEEITVQGIVGVKPVLEDCKNIKFSAMNCKIYDDLVWQMEMANIDVFNNQIYECYDFTPKKIPNFSNIQASQNDQSNANLQWQAKIQMNDLDWGMKNVYFPFVMPIKSSMISKMFNEAEIMNNSSISIIYGRGLNKQILIWLNSGNLNKNMMMVKKLDDGECLRMLKQTRHKQNVMQMTDKDGNWLFVLVKLKTKISFEQPLKNQLGVVQQRELVWKILDEHNKIL